MDECANNNQEQLACPNCQNTNSVSWVPKTIFLAKILSLGLFPLVFPIREVRHQCKHCNHEWDYWY
uniref:Uncharacterized protein n=1 Tax=uncultured Thiotrichaceae bacterium TaxID=298394 RepID=A0A6S6UP53_9GAMM|nr:MAG: Unknown protein [uncultured Thiotrichaceae bacterium]